MFEKCAIIDISELFLYICSCLFTFVAVCLHFQLFIYTFSCLFTFPAVSLHFQLFVYIFSCLFTFHRAVLILEIIGLKVANLKIYEKHLLKNKFQVCVKWFSMFFFSLDNEPINLLTLAIAITLPYQEGCSSLYNYLEISFKFLIKVEEYVSLNFCNAICNFYAH